MKLTADRRELAEALKWVALALANRPAVPALGGIRIKADADNTLTLTAHDFDTAHEATVAAEVSLPPLAIVAPGFLVRDLVGALKSPTVELSTSGKGGTTLGIKAGRSSYSVQGFPLADWPTPAAGSAEAVGTIDAEVLARTLAQVARVADDDNPVSRLAGVRLEASGGTFEAVGLRTSAVSVARAPWDGADFAAQLPVKAVAEALRGLSGEVEVSADDSTLRLSTDARTVALRLYQVDGVVEWRKVIPPAGDTAVEVEAELLLDAVKRAALTGKETPVRLAVASDGEGMAVTATDGEAATGTEELDAVATLGEVVELTFWPSVLLDALAALPPGPTTLTFGRALQVTGKADDFHHVIMPRKAATR